MFIYFFLINFSLMQKLNKFKIEFTKYINFKYAILLIVFYFLTLYRRKSIYKRYNHIHVAMSLNDNYTYPIMVSITSIVLNSNKNTFINFHILIGNDVKIRNKKKIVSLKRLKHNANFTFHNVRNTFNGWLHRRRRITVAAFYRSIVAELIKNVNKIIYLDGDTLTYGDLLEMYNLIGSFQNKIL